MEYIPHSDLSEYITRRPEEAKAEAKNIAKQILAGLVILHGRQICHRDLKPQVSMLYAGDESCLQCFRRFCLRPSHLSWSNSPTLESPNTGRGAPYGPIAARFATRPPSNWDYCPESDSPDSGTPKRTHTPALSIYGHLGQLCTRF